MLNNGFILFHRHWLRHPAMKDSARRRFLWVHILCSAYFEDSKDGKIKAGQFIATRKQLADACGLSMSALKCAIADFVDAGILTVTSAGRGLPAVWTVTDYTLTQANLGRWSANHHTDHLTDHPTGHQTNHPTDHLGSSGNAGNQRAGRGFEKGDGLPHRPPHELSHGPPHERFADHHNKQEIIKNSESKNQEKPKARARVVSDETGIEWPEPSSADFEYPESYKAMWADWQDASKVCLVTANGKLAAYKQIRRHLKTKTLTLAQLQDATANFLDKYRSSPTLFGAPQPPRFYGKQGEVFDFLGSRKEEEDAKPTPRPMRKRWSAPYTAWSCCVTVCEEFDLPIPEKDGPAKWEDVEKFHPLIIANASDDHQLRRPPEDLRQQVMT